jgi:hypothetical protein
VIEIRRANEVTASIVASSSAGTTSPRIAFSNHASGAVLIANTNGCTKIDWYAAAGPEATPYQIYASGAAVTSALTVGGIVMPDAVKPFPFIVPIVTGGTNCAMTAVLKG